MALMESSSAELPEVERTDLMARSEDGAEIKLRWYCLQHDHATAGPAVLYIHGGGMIMASVNLYDRFIANYVARSTVPMLAVEYRRAPEHPHPTPAQDCYTALKWLIEHSSHLGVNPDRVAVMGDSGGGGLAAAVALMSRDDSLPVAQQILIYPMLDDRNTTPDAELLPFATWTYDDNYTGWSCLLGDTIGSPHVSPYAAPSRASDLNGLAPMYLEVGELDIFRDECLDYARRAVACGVSTEMHLHRGCPHGFDRMGASIPVVARAMADRVRTLQAL